MFSDDQPFAPNDKGASAARPPLVPGHRLLRQIARGSYGEIWLARTELGAFRAVKVVRRANFANAKPYDREFAGIQRYEPVSREHEGLVDVLQVGSDEAAGFFYYVMELADDAGEVGRATPCAPGFGDNEDGAHGVTRPTFSPAGYSPLTLAHAIRARDRLPATEVVELGIKLARALEFLHSRRLVHRDLKPSNIIFVDGQPKLADVGLVADLGNPQSLVGTEGYFPPEGPGTAQGDIYSLGKVLYEAATGKDRQEFPDLPTDLAVEQASCLSPPHRLEAPCHYGGPGDSALLELNEVLLKACESNPRTRYSFAAAMRADLELIQAGQSLRDRRARRRRGKKLALLGSPIVIVAAIWCFLWLWRDHSGFTIVREFSVPQVTDWAAALPGNWDSLPGKELLITVENNLFAFGSDGRFLTKWSSPESGVKGISLHLVGDADGDDRDEAFVSWTSGTNCMISEVRHSGWEKTPRFIAYGREPVAKNKGPTSTLTPRLWVPAASTHDGRSKLIATLETYYGGSPRAVCCFDYETRTQYWQRIIAPVPNLVRSVDLDGDGQTELLVGSHAADNKNSLADGSDDDHSYIYAFSLTGDLLWRTELGGHFMRSEVIVQSGRNGNRPRIFTWVSSGLDEQGWKEPPKGSVAELGYDGKILRAFRHKAPVTSLIAAELGRTDSEDLLLADREGFLYQLGPDLVIKAKRQIIAGQLRPGTYDMKGLNFVNVGVLSPGHGVEAALQSRFSRQESASNPGDPASPPNDTWYEKAEIFVVGKNLEVIARYPVAKDIGEPFNWQIVAADVDGDGYDEILSLTDRVTVLKRSTSP